MPLCDWNMSSKCQTGRFLFVKLLNLSYCVNVLSALVFLFLFVSNFTQTVMNGFA